MMIDLLEAIRVYKEWGPIDKRLKKIKDAIEASNRALAEENAALLSEVQRLHNGLRDLLYG